LDYQTLRQGRARGKSGEAEHGQQQMMLTLNNDEIMI